MIDYAAVVADLEEKRTVIGTVLDGLRQLASDGLTASKLSLLSGIARNGGTFRTYLGQLRAAGWAAGDRHRIQVTDAGIEALGAYDPLPTGPDLIAWWQRELGESGMRAMLDVLVEAYPKPLTKSELA